MNTIAITFWNGLVSPLFDAAECLLIVYTDGVREQMDSAGMSVHGKAELLQRKNAAVLICGAISEVALMILRDKNIRVIPWIRGPVEEIICAYAEGTLETKRFFMPGFRKKGCPRGKRRKTRPGLTGLE